MRTLVGILAFVTALLPWADTASAWTNRGDTTFTAVSGAVTVMVGGNINHCTGDTATGRTSTPVMPWIGSSDVSITYSGCSYSGLSIAFACHGGNDALSYNALTGTTTLSLNLTAARGYGCSLRLGGTEVCRITGTLAGTYANPTATTTGVFSYPAGSLTIANGSGGTCLLGTGTASITAQSETITAAAGGPSAPHNGPIFTNP